MNVAAGAASTLLEVRLVAIRYAARDTNLYELRKDDGSPLPEAEPGAHIDVHLPNGIIRQYSLTAPGAHPASYVLGIKRDPGTRGGSGFIFDELKVGQVLKISAPRNNFRLSEAAGHSVLIAGGIGVTPIHAMAQHLAAQNKSWELHYACRSRSEAVFLEAFQNLGAVNFHFDDEAPGKFLALDQIIRDSRPGSHFYCCGPVPMLTAFEAAAKDIPAEHVHVEHFTAKEIPVAEGSFTVQLARAKKEFVVPPGRSILEVLRDADVDLPYSCEQGICGACETAVVAGTPDHHDSILSDAERAANRTMMICCSGSKGPLLVLDI